MVPFWGRYTTHFRTYFSGDWDVHWGYDLDFDPWPCVDQPQSLDQAAQVTPPPGARTALARSLRCDVLLTVACPKSGGWGPGLPGEWLVGGH